MPELSLPQALPLPQTPQNGSVATPTATAATTTATTDDATGSNRASPQRASSSAARAGAPMQASSSAAATATASVRRGRKSGHTEENASTCMRQLFAVAPLQPWLRAMPTHQGPLCPSAEYRLPTSPGLGVGVPRRGQGDAGCRLTAAFRRGHRPAGGRCIHRAWPFGAFLAMAACPYHVPLDRGLLQSRFTPAHTVNDEEESCLSLALSRRGGVLRGKEQLRSCCGEGGPSSFLTLPHLTADSTTGSRPLVRVSERNSVFGGS